MTTELWPCSRCGAPGVKNLGTQGWCRWHLADLFAEFDPAVFGLAGVGLPAGRRRPEYGEQAVEVRCNVCSAGWIADAPCDPCTWCARSRLVLAEAQAALLLQPPDIDPDDRSYSNVMAGWAERLANGCHAGVITEAEARWTLARVEGGAHDAAA